MVRGAGAGAGAGVGVGCSRVLPMHSGRYVTIREDVWIDVSDRVRSSTEYARLPRSSFPTHHID